MKCAEITGRVLEAIAADSCDFIRLNFPNGDMAGHAAYQGEYSAKPGEGSLNGGLGISSIAATRVLKHGYWWAAKNPLY